MNQSEPTPTPEPAPAPGTAAAPPRAPAAEAPRRPRLPATLLPAPEGLRRPEIFDPALKHFPRAFRAGEPTFDDPAARDAWHRARRTALDLVLAGVAGGRWADHLVLRGSVLLANWFGDAARDPGDLDLVVVPAAWAMDGPETSGLLADVARDAEAAARAHGGVAIDAAGAAVEGIWTYDRVPGRRMVLPWSAPGTPGGTVQLDLVFNEPLPERPEAVRLRPLGDGPGALVLGASPGLSLAWKLLWVVSDMHVQGKDIYDALLLAERTPPDFALVRAAFLAVPSSEGERLTPPGDWWISWLGDMEVEWEHFVREYPELAARTADYATRLRRVVAPLLAEADQPGDTPHRRWARWLAPLIDEARARAPRERVAALGELAAEGVSGLTAAVVILRELAGTEALPVRRTMEDVLAADERWATLRSRPHLRRFALRDLGEEPDD
ncbi:Nucleotidyl transferase AbiEii toxin, Type IV TA system [Streptomyces zhaozhouensis]|uniref:Nucleotidyl transferase AbiEii toxin, Type IV TA system n=1 Tax=Streptomyces zhaozhouensis TaxID=1300267 RepID=A0A286E472_9ACTN|nr:nucleotidyl transferase AbiEii/AbiGii toxin family protein [Streptomyces zhaozhouensis]SOD65702.1 Nucleotidyl transferase AbiEii toxin, Type IV TA system [Streptomyces zhaozhouensis]